MRLFNYSAIKEQKWDSDVLGLIAAIYKEAGTVFETMPGRDRKAR